MEIFEQVNDLSIWLSSNNRRYIVKSARELFLLIDIHTGYTNPQLADRIIYVLSKSLWIALEVKDTKTSTQICEYFGITITELTEAEDD